jgi:hypothetical protein
MPKYQCGQAGALPECASCLHANPHEYALMHGCGNTTWCLKKIGEARKAAGEIPQELKTCHCEACAEPFSPIGQMPSTEIGGGVDPEDEAEL